MRIKRIKVENYKSLQNVTMSGLSYVNMIYGYNNSGKSNVIKFLELLFSAKDDPERSASGESPTFWRGIIKDSSFIFKDNKIDNDIVFEISLEILKSELSLFNKNELAELQKNYFNDNHRYITLKIFGRIVYLDFYQSEIRTERVLLNTKEIFKSDKKEPYFTSASSKSILRRNGYYYFNTLMELLNNSVLFLGNNRYFEKETENDKFSLDYLSSKNFKNWFFQMSLLPEHFEIYKNLIEFISSFDINTSKKDEFNNCEENSPLKNMDLSFYRRNRDVELILQNKLGKRLPISSYGTGIQQIFYILTKIFMSNAKILLVEELELNLSPRYQVILLKNLSDMIENNNISQVIFTTHSKYFSYRNEFRIFEVNINSQGSSSIKKVEATSKKFYNPLSLL